MTTEISLLLFLVYANPDSGGVIFTGWVAYFLPEMYPFGICDSRSMMRVRDGVT